MKIVVLAGGLSPERDVSLSSGTMAVNALRGRGHKAILVDLFYGRDALPDPIELAFEEEGQLPPRPVPETAPDLAAIRASRPEGFSDEIGNGVLELCRAADITYLGLHGGCGENGSLQAFLDLSDIHYTGSPSIGCAMAMDKFIGKQLLKAAGVPVPDGVLLRKGAVTDENLLPVPCVVKPCCGGSSLGISIVHDRAALHKALEDAFAYENEILVEEYIRGREITAGVLGGRALPLIEIVPKHGFYDYQHKYQPGWTEEITPAPLDADLTQKIQELAVRGFEALQLSVYGRLDFILDAQGNAFCLEANTLPGMTPTSLLPQAAAAVGIDFPELCCKIIKTSLEKY